MVKDLKEKNELKNSFIENLSHDLRTPLIAQERALELITKEFENAEMEEQFQLAKGLEKNNTHLLRMANLILESYRIDSEDININISEVNISELVDNCYEKLIPLASEKNISLINSIPKDFPVIETDLTSLKRVLINLISNSVENIPENRKVEINTEDKGKYIELSIEDNGQGIAQKDMEHIFDRYYSGKSDERKIGSGLGLYVCKRLLDLLGGTIKVESEKDKFTRFIISLPKGK
jgi:signal transduction histidine kinase